MRPARTGRIRNATFLLAVLMYVGTAIELVASKHYQEPLQWVPFILCALGAFIALAGWMGRLPGAWRKTVTILLGLIAAGSLWGIYAHLQGNLEFVRETRPQATFADAAMRTFQGRNPVLAPMALAVGAAITMLAMAIDAITRQRNRDANEPGLTSARSRPVTDLPSAD